MRIDYFSARSGQQFRSRVLPGLIFAAAISSSSGAFAQCTSVATGAAPAFVGDVLTKYASASAAAAGAISGALGNLSTAFQTQQGSAFVSAPSDPKPDQPGGGVWARSVGGQVTNDFSSKSTATVSDAGLFAGTQNQNTTCSGSVHQSFAGMQVGTDISRLNWAGWNVHVGTTAGYLAAHAFSNSGSSVDLEVPFFGGYVVATKGRFFADLLVREEFYNGNTTDFNFGTYGQKIAGHGVSVATSAGYNFPLADNWFIEPSGGFIWSRTTVDNFNVGSPLTLATGGGVGFVPGALFSTASTDPILSEIGRLSLRAGTTVTSGNIVWQPFASASVFREFAGNVTSSVATPVVPTPALPVLALSTSTSRVGTYGQYSLGIAAQVANTGWLGFARLDYRNGSNIEGWTGNAGVRYQFSPEAVVSVMPTKAPVKALGIASPVTNWTGVYIGGFAGAASGKTDIRFVNDPNNEGNNPRAAGFLGGAQLGYNYQFANNVVLGVEGDFGVTNLKGAKPCGVGGRDPVTGLPAGGGNGPGTFTPDALTCENTSNWMATAAARIGYSWNRTLVFLKAGGAWADDSVDTNCIFGPNNGAFAPRVFSTCFNQANQTTNGFGTSGHRSGWLLGAGTEFDLGHNWSAKAEYDYIDFGTRTALATDGTTTLRDSGAINQVKIGVNYRFGPQAVVARY